MPTFTPATSPDRGTLATMMRDFYAGERLAFTDFTLGALNELFASPTLGRAFLIQDDAQTVAGYLILTLSFSLERGGKIALLDELYIVPGARKKGLGKAALAFAISEAENLNCKAILLEVDHANAAAKSLYHRAGFQVLSRHFMFRAL